MTVQPRLCFTCLYLTVYTDGSPLSLVRIEKACSNIKDKCCMKKRPRIRRVQEYGRQTTSDKSVIQQNDGGYSVIKQKVFERDLSRVWSE